MTRRTFVAAAAAAPLAASTKWKVSIFSKHLHWADYKEMAEVSKELGFDGVDLTVREGGHVEPARVEDDLPKAAEAIKAAGLELPMITAGIVDVKSPHAEAILKTMRKLGIKYYRWGGFKYKETGPILDQLKELKPAVRDLEAINESYGVCAMYHTHSGPLQIGASQWDLAYLLFDCNPKYVGFNYDIGHATVEGGYGGWIHSTRLALPMMRGVAVKDFRFARSEKGRWEPVWCPLGEGMVNFKQFFDMIRAGGFDGPVQLHYEYKSLGGADSGKKTITMPKPELKAAFKRDLDYLRKFL